MGAGSSHSANTARQARKMTTIQGNARGRIGSSFASTPSSTRTLRLSTRSLGCGLFVTVLPQENESEITPNRPLFRKRWDRARALHRAGVPETARGPGLEPCASGAPRDLRGRRSAGVRIARDAVWVAG